MDDWEKEAFRWFELIHQIERAMDVISQYRDGIDYWRKQIGQLNRTLGWLSGRRGDSEPPLMEEVPW